MLFLKECFNSYSELSQSPLQNISSAVKMNALSRINYSQNYFRNVKNITRVLSCSNSSDEKWRIAIKNAEKVVGYPTSFMNLRWLLTDEISNIASYVSKLIGTKHPMLAVARDLIQQNDTAKWGLIVLLVSKAAGIRPEIDEEEQDGLSGILHTQRGLAEITEMIKTGNQMHNCMVNVSQKDENYNNLHFGNKLALLSGDYLYSKSFKDLALLNNNDLNEIIATSLRDMAHANYIQPRNKLDEPLPSKPKLGDTCPKLEYSDIEPYDIDKFLGHPREEWILRNMLGGVSLLAKSCKGAMILGGHPVELQQKAFALGRSLGLAWQIKQEFEALAKDSFLSFSLTSAPVLFNLEEDPDMYEMLEHKPHQFKEIKNRILRGSALLKTNELLEDLRYECFNILDGFPRNASHRCLKDLVIALKHSF